MESLADRVRRRGAGRHDRKRRSLGILPDRDLARCHVRDDHRHEERRDLARAALEHALDLLLDGADAADARSDIDAEALRLDGAFSIEAGILHGFVRGDERKLREAVVVLCLCLAEHGFSVEALDLGCDLDAEIRRIEGRDLADAALAGNQGIPALVCSETDGRDSADAGNDNSAVHIVPSFAGSCATCTARHRSG